MFSDQEVPGDEAEQEPEKAPKITSLPAADLAGPAIGEEEILYSDTVTPISERMLAVDNEDVQGFLNLGEIFSFHNFEENEEELFPVSSSIATGYSNDGDPEEGASNYTVAQGIVPQMMTDDTFPVYHDDVANALSHNGNEFLPTPEDEVDSLLQTGGECFQLGRGEPSPMRKDRKENSDEKTYLHPVRFPCRDASEDARSPTERQLSSSWKQEAASPDSDRCAERQPTKRIRTVPLCRRPLSRQGIRIPV